MRVDKRILNFLVIIVLTNITFLWTFFVFHKPYDIALVAVVTAVRILSSIFILKDYSLSWSKVSQKTFLIKSFVYISAFAVYMPVFYGEFRLSFLASELFFYLFSINFLMYLYYYYINKSKITKTKTVVIYGAGKAGLKLEAELEDTKYKTKYFIDDDKVIQNRSIDSIDVICVETFKKNMKNAKLDLLVIAMPSAPKERAKEIYNELSSYFSEIKVLPSLSEIFHSKEFSAQLKDISVEDLLARYPKDLDKNIIEKFIKNKVVMISGAGGSIGSELALQCQKYGAKKLILLDNSEYNLYTINEKIKDKNSVSVMQNVVDKESLEKTFSKYKPQIVLHAAAYKHVPLVEENINEAVINNVLGTKNLIDLAIKFDVQKFVMISTDKAVRPTNVMGATKRVCEIYAQNISCSLKGQKNTEIVSVRFGNVLGSSGSVVPKFKSQIKNGQNLTVTHPEITRYFMLISEACELVLQAAAIGEGAEIFILDMGKPVKILDLAKKMIELSTRDDIDIEFSGLRAGEKLYEELIFDENEVKTPYESITIAKSKSYDIDKLTKDIQELLESEDKIQKLKEILPEFQHQKNC